MSRRRFYIPTDMERADILDEMIMIFSQLKSARAGLAGMRKMAQITNSPNWPPLELELIQAINVMEAAVRDCYLRLLGQLPLQ